MKMKKRLTIAIIAALVLCLAVFAAVYTRPLKIEQRYPEIDLSQCTQISGYYRINGTGDEMIRFVFDPEDAQFNEMIGIFQTVGFKRSIQDLLPKGTNAHTDREGDFQWTVSFRFENVRSNKAVLSGELLSVDDFYGDLQLSFDGKPMKCSADETQNWSKRVLDVMMQDNRQ